MNSMNMNTIFCESGKVSMHKCYEASFLGRIKFISNTRMLLMHQYKYCRCIFADVLLPLLLIRFIADAQVKH